MAAPGSVRIEVLSPERYAQDFAVMQEFLSGKHLCCICPLSCLSSEADHRREHQGWPADKQSLGAVAVGVDGEIIGIVQMALHGHPATLHPVKPGECYIEHLAVTASARGQGVGTKLLAWCEATARARGAAYLSLEVVNGNPAIRLYEREGFVSVPQDPVGACCSALFVALCFGRVYGCFGPCGSQLMHKRLSGQAPVDVAAAGPPHPAVVRDATGEM